MLILLSLSLITLLIAFIVMFLSSILSKKLFSTEKKTPLMNVDLIQSDHPICHFFYIFFFFFIAVIFLIFDVEITLPIASIFNIANIYSWMSTSILFSIILLMGLYYEWDQGALEWPS